MEFLFDQGAKSRLEDFLAGVGAILGNDERRASIALYAIGMLEPPSLSRKQMVRLIKERYRTEAVYQELKGEFGLDHFEGRRFRGWHHHVSVVLCCHAFVLAERAHRFPPSAGRTAQAHPVSLAA